MKKISKKGWIEIAISATIFSALLIIASFYDLKINIALYAPHTLFGQFFAHLGELPAHLAIPTVGVIFFHQNFAKTPKYNTIIKLLSIAIIAAGWYLTVNWVWNNFSDSNIDFSIVYKIFFVIFMTIMTVLGTYRLNSPVMRKLFIFAVFTVIVVALSNGIVQLMKIIWARQRFRTMVDVPQNADLLAAYGYNFEGFTPWYKPMSILKSELRSSEYMRLFNDLDSDAFKSFPSGHVVAASASFSLILLPDIFAKLNKYRWAFWVTPICYTVLVAISRIVMGAHYLSDVIFGGFIGFTIAIVSRFIIIQKIINKQTENEKNLEVN
ncbi:MAG: phosphatase PAP2 family protein [Christensenellaceae bacterium]|jgi:membrane-associated phospholipid phosphatase|nr:phosphatase PAP2 family protein [Christensenellaceae bacterium]